MKLLLDENLPKRLKSDFPDHETYAVSDLGWNGKTNGELLKLMIESKFDVFITFDKNLQYQQNLSKYPIPVIVLNAIDNSYITLSVLTPKINLVLRRKLAKGAIEIKE